MAQDSPSSTIDFSDLRLATVVTNQYANRGVIFRGNLRIGTDPLFKDSRVLAGFPFGKSSIVGEFVALGDASRRVFARNVTVELLVYGEARITWSDSNCLGNRSQTVNGSGPLKFTFPGRISSFVVSVSDNDCLLCTVTIDHLTFALDLKDTSRPSNVFDRPINSIIQKESCALPCSIRELLGDNDHFWLDSGLTTSTGHHYIALNSLGESDLNPADIMTEIKFDPNRAFPYLNAVGKYGSEVKIGNQYSLQKSRLVSFPVKVTQVGNCSFTFQTLPGHVLKGQATHGILKDSTGELWLFQDGAGEPDKESLMLMLGNYFVAENMWERMATNVKRLMSGMQSPVKKPSVFQISDHLLTEIPVQNGDEITISASGVIRFGSFAGGGGPDGIRGFEGYSYFPNARHGALLARVRRYGTEDWHVIGSSNVFVADATGTLELLVNDADPDNNVGYFTVKINIRPRTLRRK